MKGSNSKNVDKNDSRSKSKINGVSNFSMKKNKNFQRMGGRGLSLEAFANAKTKTAGYNPAVIKKKREFYKNAKYVSKYKKQVKHQTQQNNLPLSLEPTEGENEFKDRAKSNHTRKHDKHDNRKRGTQNLENIYAKKREEQQKLQSERKAAINAKREERERSEAKRKELREKMFKKTRKGQPVMKYRIEHLLQTIQRSAN